ncbi:hypothetical protein D2T31_12040 [Sinirhodobacter populi]|uniref:Uncharacterized protein n=1 Tax=Paenirhodobacter populi TaxID=2306993 RepID=A0A443K7Y2_9RHOB|nr:hypothetical protein [Sinirhodobacter populi]RWR28836.1 hypothetical protein D2T31_12040 [Sinirhodobacter populi]
MSQNIRIKITSGDRTEKPPFWKGVRNGLVFFGMLFGPGIIADSPAMQWAGFSILVMIFALALIHEATSWMTVEEAEKKIAEIKAGH